MSASVVHQMSLLTVGLVHFRLLLVYLTFETLVLFLVLAIKAKKKRSKVKNRQKNDEPR